MEGLSPKQQRIADFIAGFIDDKGYSPSLQEIATGCGIGSATVAKYYVNVLKRKGYIRREGKVSRGISLIKETPDVVSVPLLGTIAAGEPIPVPDSGGWASEPEDMIKMPAAFVRGKTTLYALKVKGASMIDALIDDGDLVIMEPVHAADNGDMVAAWLKEEQETTLKKIYQEHDRVRLQPANLSMSPIYVAPDNVEVQGRVSTVIRMLGR